MSRPPARRFVPQYMSEWADRGEWPSTNRRPFRAYLVSKRVRLGGAKSASFTRGTASTELFLLASSSVFEVFLTKESFQDRSSEYVRTPKRFNPHLYRTGSYTLGFRELICRKPGFREGFISEPR